jgi:protein TonB
MANVYGVEGKLIMRVQVLADGTPGQMLLKQSSGNGILDRDAREQLARWRFNPARKNGQAVTAWVDVPVTYRLPEDRK